MRHQITIKEEVLDAPHVVVGNWCQHVNIKTVVMDEDFFGEPQITQEFVKCTLCEAWQHPEEQLWNDEFMLDHEDLKDKNVLIIRTEA